MYNLKTKNEVIAQFIKFADANLELVGSYGDLYDSMMKDDAEMVKYLIKAAVKNIKAAVPEGIDVPDVSVYSNQSGDDAHITMIDMVLRNKHNSEVEFKFKHQIVCAPNAFEVLCDFLKTSWVELITDAVIRANLDEVNAKLAEIGEAAGNDFKVRMVSPMGRDGAKAVKITDEELVLVVDESRILNMEDVLIFCEPSEVVSQELIDRGYEETVARFAKAQTTPQFLGLHEPLVEHLCDISKLVKPITIIKKVYSKNVQKLRSKKDALAYFNNGEVFSVVAVTPDGMDIALKPFNIETLEVSDFDVLEAI